MDVKVKAAAAKEVLNMMEAVCKFNDSYNEKEREVDGLFRYILQELNALIVCVIRDTTRTSERLELEGYIDVHGNLLIRRGRLSEHLIRPVKGVEFDDIIEEALKVFKNIDGFGTICCGSNKNGYTIIIDATVKGRN